MHNAPAPIGPPALGAGALFGDSVPDYAPSIPQQPRVTTIPGIIGQPPTAGNGVTSLNQAMGQLGFTGFQTVNLQEGRFTADETAKRALAINGCASVYATMSISRVLQVIHSPSSTFPPANIQ